MGTIRQEKVANLLKRELAGLFVHKGNQILKGKMITVTVVRISPDLKNAKAYLSIFPTDDLKSDIEQVRAHSSEIRFEIGKNMRNQLRAIPEILYYGDDSLDYAEQINELLDN